MIDPLTATGLASNWIQQLQKLWTSVRETRRSELLEIHNTFGNPELLAQLYVEPDCQHINPADHDEDEPGRAIRQPIREWLNGFLKGEFLQDDGRNTVFILSDSGMGKTSLLMMLKLTHFFRFWPAGINFELMKLGPETLDILVKVQERKKTILLLDALDEDSTAWGRIEERLSELLRATRNFRQVILTCRTQFFPELGVSPIEVPGKVEVSGFVCNLLYLAPFNDRQVEAYLRKVYPNSWLKRIFNLGIENSKLNRARQLVGPMKSLRMRPMLIAHIDDLMQAEIDNWSEYRIYKALVRNWLLREVRKRNGSVTEEQLWSICLALALRMQEQGDRKLSPDGIDDLLTRQPSVKRVKEFDMGIRSLLNRTSDGGFRFSHYSIQEFFVAHSWIENSVPGWLSKFHITDQFMAFLLSWIAENPSSRLFKLRLSQSSQSFDVRIKLSDYFNLEGCSLTRVNLEGAYLRGANLSHADLVNANLSHANLAGADLRSARLESAILRGAVLTGATLTHALAVSADFSGADLRGANLSLARIEGARFEGANLEQILAEETLPPLQEVLAGNKT